MKNAHTVCACNNVGELNFDGLGGIIIGKFRNG